MTGPRRLELHLSYDCGQRCAFCSESGRMARWRAAPLRAEEIARVLVGRRRAGFDHVTFTGGEPTAHPLLKTALGLARRLGYRTYLTTNGGRFADAEYARGVLPLVGELCLSVHGPDAASHDACSRTPGSFERAMRALRNVERYGARTTLLTNTVATRLNWDGLDGVLSLLRKRRKVSHCLVSNVAPEGRAVRAYARLAVPLAWWRERASAWARSFEGSGAVLRFFGLPLCALGGRLDLSNDAHFSPRETVERRAAGGAAGLAAIVSLDASRGRRKAEACASCAASADCAGVFARYLDVFGAGELEAAR
jgi:organic radical activating enzyme